MDVKRLAGTLHQAYVVGEPLPVPSGTGQTLALADAYAVQHEYVQLRLAEETVAGFKAGATAPAPQKAFGLTEPITGVLFRSGDRKPGTTLRLSDYRALMLEAELGFRIGKAVRQVPRDVDALREHIDACMPMVELADIPFGGAKFTGPDLIAGNSASRAYIVGPEPDWRSVNINAVQVRFSRDGVTLHEAPASDVMGDQWQALLWLVGRIVEQGYPLEPGHILMTGSIGAAHPGKPGSYLADFGTFGQVGFEVVA
jgi:2-keto-4-pentenoate hydratase